MKIRDYKSFLGGIIVATVLFTVIGYGLTIAGASPVRTALDVFFNDIQILVNGARLNPTDVQGNRVEPFIHDGTTYLPVRAVAEALDLPVEWDQETYTVYLGDKEPDKTVFGIQELEPWDIKDCEKNDFAIGRSGWEENDGKFVMSKQEYISSNSISLDKQVAWGFDATVTYKLDKDFKKLTGLFGVDDSASFGEHAGAKLSIYGDGELLRQVERTYGERPVEVNIDLIGIDELIIDFSDAGNEVVTPIRHNFIDVKLTKIDTR